MVIDRADFLIDLIREHHLLEPERLEELSRTPDASETAPQLLGQCLIELGWLTPYQVDCLIQQQPQDLLLGSYHLLDRLGQGETGPVFQARKPGKAGTVVLKAIPKARLADPQLQARFQQEVRAAAQLQHPNIAPVTAVGQHGNSFLFAREFVPGADLGRMVRELGPLPPFLACNAIRQAALALQCAHDKGLSHRRVKAFNLIVVDQPCTEGTVKLVDFGLGQLNRGASAGLDVPGDLAALGQTLSFLLTGQTSPSAVGGLPAEVGEIVRRFAPDAADRFYTAWEASQALEPHCHEPAPAAPAPFNDAMAPAIEPADIPIASAAVAAVPVGMPETSWAAAESVPIAEPPPTEPIVPPMPLEGIAVPVMGTVGIAVGPEAPTVSPPLPEPAPPEPVSPAAISAEAVPEALAEVSPVVQAVVSEPAIAKPPAPDPIPFVEATPAPTGASSPEPSPPSPLEELLGTGIAVEKPSDDDWAPLQNYPESAPAPAVSEPAPGVAIETPPPLLEAFGAHPLNDGPEAMPPAPFPSPAGIFTDQPQSTAVTAEEPSGYPLGAALEPTSRRAPAKKKWSRRDIMWIVVGALLWVIVGVLIVVIVAIRSNRAAPPKNNRPNVPGKQKSKSRAELINASPKRR